MNKTQLEIPGQPGFTPKKETQPCSECQVGLMHLRGVTYLTYIGDEMIMVPDFPAWVCDVCGRSDYDEAALNRLSLLLSPNAGSAPALHHRRSVKSEHVGKKNARAAKVE